MLKSPGGPVAVFAGSRVTMPYGMSVLGLELMRQCFSEQPETLGEVILAAKRRMMSGESGGRYRAALDAIAAAFSPAGDQLEAERAEHLDLFNLLGDPLLRVLMMQLTVNAGDNVRGTVNISGINQTGLAGASSFTLSNQTFNSFTAPAPSVLTLLGLAALYTHRRRSATAN